jgi:hypothetical protein
MELEASSSAASRANRWACERHTLRQSEEQRRGERCRKTRRTRVCSARGVGAEPSAMATRSKSCTMVRVYCAAQHAQARPVCQPVLKRSARGCNYRRHDGNAVDGSTALALDVVQQIGLRDQRHHELDRRVRTAECARANREALPRRRCGASVPTTCAGACVSFTRVRQSKPRGCALLAHRSVKCTSQMSWPRCASLPA